MRNLWNAWRDFNRRWSRTFDALVTPLIGIVVYVGIQDRRWFQVGMGGAILLMDLWLSLVKDRQEQYLMEVARTHLRGFPAWVSKASVLEIPEEQFRREREGNWTDEDERRGLADDDITDLGDGRSYGP